MVQKKFNLYIEGIFADAIAKGFYTCPNCSGEDSDQCSTCKGTGFYRDKKSLYMHIIKECAEASTAEERSKKIIPERLKHMLSLIPLDAIYNFNISYEKEFKGTIEEELADIAIIIFSLCGYLHIDLDETRLNERPYEDITEWNRSKIIDSCLFDISSDICSSYYFKYDRANHIMSALSTLFSLAKALSIPLEVHMLLKIKYNLTRSPLHKGEHDA